MITKCSMLALQNAQTIFDIFVNKYAKGSINIVFEYLGLNSLYPGVTILRLLQIKYTLIRQLLRCCLIRLYFSCLCVTQEDTFFFVPVQ